MQTKLRGQTLLMVVSILLIIGCAFTIIVSILGIIGGSVLAAAGGSVGQVVGGILIVSLVITLLAGVFQLITGICGIRFRARAEKAGTCFILGIVLLVIGLASWGLSAFATGEFNWLSALISMVLPVLYIVGASLNKSGTNA